MSEPDRLAARFEEQRIHLRAVAYRMLGSLPEADEAVQDTWLRVSRAGADGVENFRAWLTTILARVCLNMLQARKVRAEEPEATPSSLPDPIVTPDGPLDPEHEVMLADSVGLALQIILETLPAPERLAFVLHDMFDLPFDEIAAIMGRTSAATRQLASRGRRRVQGAAASSPERDLARQREVVDAYMAAAHRGDFDALVSLLDPDVVSRSDGGGRLRLGPALRRGPEEVARGAIAGARRPVEMRPALVNGAAGVVLVSEGRVYAVIGFIVAKAKIVEIDLVLDPERLARLDLGAFGL